MIIRRHAIPISCPIRKTSLVIGDCIHSWKPGCNVRSRTIDDGGRTATTCMVGATGWRVRHYSVSMRDVFAGEGSSFVLRAACVGEFAGLGVAHRGTPGGWWKCGWRFSTFPAYLKQGARKYINYSNLKFPDMWKSRWNKGRDGRSLSPNCDFLSPCSQPCQLPLSLIAQQLQTINASMEPPHDGLVCGDKYYKPRQQPIMLL